MPERGCVQFQCRGGTYYVTMDHRGWMWGVNEELHDFLKVCGPTVFYKSRSHNSYEILQNARSGRYFGVSGGYYGNRYCGFEYEKNDDLSGVRFENGMMIIASGGECEEMPMVMGEDKGDGFHRLRFDRFGEDCTEVQFITWKNPYTDAIPGFDRV